MSVPKETEQERDIVTRSQRTIEIPLRRVRTITRISSKENKKDKEDKEDNKYLSCILCNKTLDISNTDHHCEIRPCVNEFSIKFT
ncbi:MAG: hypothetical protein ACEQSC_01645 [Candidatus Nanopelagicaceae bacterium]